jgi:hypothetical protein
VPPSDWLARQGYTNVLDGGAFAFLSEFLGYGVPLGEFENNVENVAVSGNNISWDSVPGAEGYRVFFFDSAEDHFNPTDNVAAARGRAVAVIENNTENTVSLNDVDLPDGVYYVRIQAIAQGRHNSLLSYPIVEITVGHMPVAAIVGVLEEWPLDTELNLNQFAAVTPHNASNQVINWEIIDNGAGATISGSTITASTAGTARLQATVTNGIRAGEDFVSAFEIEFASDAVEFVQLSELLDLPYQWNINDSLTIADLDLFANFYPINATNREVNWNITGFIP